MPDSSAFATRLLTWFDQHGRHDLPWQHPRTPYRVWVAEIMLQQTQVATVIPFFERFMQTLPDIPTLAAASEDTVLGLWSGLGYYRRARFLHAAAKTCVARHAGRLPSDPDALKALPGIGESTAGAILAQAFGQQHPILDGNVKRVLARYHGVHGYPGKSQVARQLWQYARQHTPQTRVADYTQAIMDLGATVCVRSQPLCTQCPFRTDCVAYNNNLTAQLPTRKPKVAIPEKRTHMLLLINAQRHVLLYKRAAHGVWPALWSLPEASATRAIPFAQELVHAGEARLLPEIRHAFSHYRLVITPMLFAGVTCKPQCRTSDTYHWYSYDQARALGLPAPVRKLLDDYFA